MIPWTLPAKSQDSEEANVERMLNGANTRVNGMFEGVTDAFSVPPVTIVVEGAEGGEHSITVDSFVGDVIYELLRYRRYIKRIIIEP